MDQIYLIFLWHMHQPYYRDPLSGSYRLPWVRLHGIKDYYDMPAILEDFPVVRQTFNLVPSLIEQINDYVNETAKDQYLAVSLKSADDLDTGEKIFILENFFMANWDNMIYRFPRYGELLTKRGPHSTHSEIKRAGKYFTRQDFLDLQVWFNLAWFDPMFRDSDQFLMELVQKGRDYTESEKKLLLEKQREILSKIVPKYRSMQETGQIELSTTPYFHPILPLLWDSDRAKECMPHSPLPTRFNHPEDAKEQIRRAVEFHEQTFGSPPSGMWPSEGSVSQEILSAFQENSIKWIASDEGVLANSLKTGLRDYSNSGALTDPATLYQPYRLSNDIGIFFRDHALSDLFGFDYHKMKARDAVDNFIGRLWGIHQSLPKDRAYAVPVILDGENAWEWYKNDGRDFLLYLYERLSNETFVKCATASEFLAEHPPSREISHLYAGSWINSDFGIWIGHEEDRKAWELLSRTRDDLEALLINETFSPEAVEEAWRSIYIAEGSDWCWWYGDEHATDTQADFDELFRNNLINVYLALGKEPPPDLQLSVLREDRNIRVPAQPRGFIQPVIDGESTNYFEWLAAGSAEIGGAGGSMHRSDSLMSHLYFGFDLKTLYLRIDGNRPFGELDLNLLSFEFHFIKPLVMKVIVASMENLLQAELYKSENGEFSQIKTLACGLKDILELGVLFEDIGAAENDEIRLYITCLWNGELLERWPSHGILSIKAPTANFEAAMWS